MKILLQKQHSIKINVSDGKYECHLQHLPPHSDELRSHYIDCSINSWFQTYWRIGDYSGAVSYMIALFLSIFSHSWRQNTGQGRLLAWPTRHVLTKICQRSFIQCCSSLFFTSIGAWYSLETCIQVRRCWFWVEVERHHCVSCITHLV